ncbi:MAG TPA: NADH-quinone oxidoreductase subunit J [Candidatus Dormibacteraeota bacterium]|nr:NADH-quinone oxidoreductase subunit J [Candidatus Dormibacteraeota bacterium]
MSSGVLFAIAFYVVAGATLVSALAVVMLRNIVRSAVALIACFFMVAWLYLMLSADFLWVAQLLIYAGAIPVLIVFAIMFTRRSMSDTSAPDSNDRPWAALVGGGIFLLLVAVLVPASWKFGDWPGLAGTTAKLGNELVNHYALPFELISVLLVVALIGAVVLARHEGSDTT